VAGFEAALSVADPHKTPLIRLSGRRTKYLNQPLQKPILLIAERKKTNPFQLSLRVVHPWFVAVFLAIGCSRKSPDAVPDAAMAPTAEAAAAPLWHTSTPRSPRSGLIGMARSPGMTTREAVAPKRLRISP
jgi:hypothetical protein